MDTAEEFKAETGEGLDEGDIGSLNIVDEEDPDVEEKLPEDGVVDPLLPLEDEEDDKEPDELDDKAEIEAYMYQDYEER